MTAVEFAYLTGNFTRTMISKEPRATISTYALAQLQSLFGRRLENIDPSRNDKENLVSLSYMIRCCFAHGTAVPTREMSPKFRTTYKIGSKTIDLSNVARTPFDFSAIGGHETLWLMRDEAKSLCIISRKGHGAVLNN
jgi:hypothetical protein